MFPSATTQAIIAPVVHVVDDDASLRTAIGRLLQAAGYEVRCYASAGEFLVSRPKEASGCLVLDVRMPGLSSQGPPRPGAAKDARGLGRRPRARRHRAGDAPAGLDRLAGSASARPPRAGCCTKGQHAPVPMAYRSSCSPGGALAESGGNDHAQSLRTMRARHTGAPFGAALRALRRVVPLRGRTRTRLGRGARLLRVRCARSVLLRADRCARSKMVECGCRRDDKSSRTAKIGSGKNGIWHHASPRSRLAEVLHDRQ
jgi:CheY-like chemotaxis protein